MPLWISFVLLGIGSAAIFVELFVPAFGVIGIIGGAGIIVSIVFGFIFHGPWWGGLLLGISVIASPFILSLGMKILPKTFLGKRLILNATQKKENGFTATAVRKIEGMEGVAITVLRPAGTAEIDGEKVSVVTGGEFIERGTRIMVVRVEGARILVKKTGV